MLRFAWVEAASSCGADPPLLGLFLSLLIDIASPRMIHVNLVLDFVPAELGVGVDVIVELRISIV